MSQSEKLKEVIELLKCSKGYVRQKAEGKVTYIGNLGRHEVEVDKHLDNGKVLVKVSEGYAIVGADELHMDENSIANFIMSQTLLAIEKVMEVKSEVPTK